MISKITFKPDEFFRDINTELNISYAAVVVALIGLVDMGRSIIILLPVFRTLSGNIGAFAAIPLAMSVLASFLSIFVLWIIYAGVIHIISTTFLNKSGEFRVILTAVGLGYFPRLIGEIISVGLASWQILRLPGVESSIGVTSYLLVVANSPVNTMDDILSIIFLGWSAFICVFAVKHVYQTNVQHATYTIGVLAALEMSWILYNIVGSY